MGGDLLQVEVAYARPEEQVVLKVDVPSGTTVREVIEQSGALLRYPEIALDGDNRVGIHARLVGLDDRVAHGDRVEIYRPLKADPKEVRRQRAAAGKA
ncbi:RnfH family protein [Flagellatimonas centrodinii]|uniref:RnfH family protein n=1 Tax=Flagellatimonas centrodinii TaxID=2806210 RepID=UPI001FEDFCEE|nr:RnfH family protein [Flagellatimonas centrodinii]ULQ46414.1 RnfH family protein [Flagellatimonas centrodinii]